MTTIFSVDPSMQAWPQDGQRPPAKDFAHELARHDAQAKSNPAENADARASSDEQQGAAPGKPGAPAMPETPGVAAQSDALSAPALARAQQLAQVEVTPIGVTEALLGARVFGWHAMAQSYLSELSAAGSAADAVPSEAATGMAAQETADTQPAAPAPAVDATVETETAAVNPQVAEIAPVPARATTGTTASSSAAEVSTADAAAPNDWSERSLRYLRQRGGASVAWLRDFRLSDTEAAHLIQWVLSDAKAKGVVLSKIMLNGREAWASPDAQ